MPRPSPGNESTQAGERRSDKRKCQLSDVPVHLAFGIQTHRPKEHVHGDAEIGEGPITMGGTLRSNQSNGKTIRKL